VGVGEESCQGMVPGPFRRISQLQEGIHRFASHPLSLLALVPFVRHSDRILRHHHLPVLIQVAKNKLRPTIPPTTPPAMKELIEISWNQVCCTRQKQSDSWRTEYKTGWFQDPTVRPTCKELLEKLEVLEKDWQVSTATKK
jgi:hypothetical protein